MNQFGAKMEKLIITKIEKLKNTVETSKYLKLCNIIMNQ